MTLNVDEIAITPGTAGTAGDGYTMVNIARRLGYIDIQDK